MKVTGKLFYLSAALFTLVMLVGGCNGAKVAPYGTVDVDVMDSASLEYTHVYITVIKIGFHANPDAGSNSPGWQVQDISAHPVTIDLAQLTNGKLYANSTADNTPLFSDLEIPTGTYRQIRLHLAPSEDAKLASSARALGLSYNNQATFDNGTEAPVRFPNSGDGIKLVPETPFVVAIGKRVSLALDFNLMDDMLEVYPAGQVECIMKPRLGYFDMASTGAIKGKIAFGNLSSPYFVIKAEQVLSGQSCRVVRRTATVDKNSGEFILYPLPVPDGATTAVYDIVVRGDNVQTTIVKGVMVRKWTTPEAGAVNLGTITFYPGRDFTAQLSDPFHPSGAWVNFYQTLTTDPVPFEVRNRHLDPYTGKFSEPIALSSELIQVYDFSAGTLSGPTSDATTTPGGFFASTEAPLFGRSDAISVSGTADTMTTFTPNRPTALPSANRIDANITIASSLRASLNKGYLFVTSGGLVVDCYQVDGIIAAGGGSYSVPGLPGGTAANPLSGAYYGMQLLGWGGGRAASGSQFPIDLSSGDASASIALPQ